VEVAFYKYEGLGNDFIVLDGGREVTPAQAIALCDRHLGVGADGVLMVRVANGRASMRVVNADGSRSEMCGNGLRCVALHLVRTGALSSDAFVVDTDAGPHACRVMGDGAVTTVEVEMAVPSLEPEQVPVRADAPLVDAPFDVGGRSLRVTAVSMGNPHVVTFDDVGDARLELGPLLESDPRFPERVNAGFARLDPSGSAIHLTVYERGVGWTRACGTGACAAAVAAVETKKSQRDAPVRVRLPGGELEIRVRAPGAPVLMTGPARLVFEGRALL
jgi:diaminopimelate epimerase